MKFIVPILDRLQDHTGWVFMLLCGGPEPGDGSMLNMMGYVYLPFSPEPVHPDVLLFSIHSGATSGQFKMNFGVSERPAWK